MCIYKPGAETHVTSDPLKAVEGLVWGTNVNVNCKMKRLQRSAGWRAAIVAAEQLRQRMFGALIMVISFISQSSLGTTRIYFPLFSLKSISGFGGIPYVFHLYTGSMISYISTNSKLPSFQLCLCLQHAIHSALSLHRKLKETAPERIMSFPLTF